VFGGLGGVLLLALAWVAGLRRQVRRRTIQLRAEIEDRKRIEAEMEKTHREMMAISRQAGMAEVATSILHNVGNVLNSVNVSSGLILDNLQKSKLTGLTKAVAMLQAHSSDLPGFFEKDPKGNQLVAYLGKLDANLEHEHKEILKEVHTLQANIFHIKEIVAMQQDYARVSGVVET